ncbi:hypothetical protein B0T26DRAFT_647051 [Lasiosphaeria miniovina]|uniref:CCD97-like C-terminal domain-containing protein n=1 Tax=Lasiosphaeria miniovina TaxID=1954250 RepID=A0AA40AK26_9PEZI|nr:uncharacterized protein B0T26DRAFT_647051 [Lasiosphaeria miniovina]KAK0717237.1 hypothetical protein B0T26DRAFT_647051 [Lasiosphaeria miniovina]
MPSFDSPPTSLDMLSAPRRRPPRSPSQSARIRVQNRRAEYLLRNPDYFNSTDHELADPLLYDFLVRRFQTPAEREAEGRAKGYARVLEGSLLRGEERLAKLEDLETEMAAPPRTRAGGRQQWEAYLRDRFIRGGDDDFEYARIDGDDEYDVLERAEQEDAWFDEEDPSWASDSPAASSNSSSGAGAHDRRPVERILTGETGIQDF